jgi:hypothetical protein
MNLKVPSKDPRTFVPSALQDSGLVNLIEFIQLYLWNEIKGGGCKKKGREGKRKEMKGKSLCKVQICGIRAISIWTNPTFSNTTCLLLLASNF